MTVTSSGHHKAMETLFLLTLIGLGLYFFFVKGLPLMVSTYASYKYTGHVNINSLNLLRLTIRGVTFSKNSFKVVAEEISFSPNFFSHGYSSLVIAHISNVKIEADLSQVGRNANTGKPGGSLNLQQIVGMICYIRFLVTFIFKDVSVKLKNIRNAEGK